MRIQDLRNDPRVMRPTNPTLREIAKIWNVGVHHSATAQGDKFTFSNHWRNLGWLKGGYHEIILRDGTVQLIYPDNWVVNGIRGHNTNTYHICVVGNGSFTDAQMQALEQRCIAAITRFNLKTYNVLGHNEFRGAATSCPGMNMRALRERIDELMNQMNTSNPTGTDTSQFFHNIQRGDTLTSIARQHGTTVANLKAWNGLRDDRIIAGNRLIVRLGNPPKDAPAPNPPVTPPRVVRPTFVRGRTYRLLENMNIRTGAGTNFGIMPRASLTANARANTTGNNSTLRAGTSVTVQEVRSVGNDIWLRIPSGWIAGFHNNRQFVR